ncbi:MAG: hypothetical protein QXX30_00505 [Candidatus Aenigmatarchaeota archaeon]
MIKEIVNTEIFEKIFVNNALLIFRYYVTKNGKKFDFNERRRFPLIIFENYNLDTILDLSAWFIKNLYHYRSAPFESLLDNFIVNKIKSFNKDIVFFVSDYSIPSEETLGASNKVRLKILSNKSICRTKNIFKLKRGQLFVPDYYITFKNVKPEETSLSIEVSSMLGKLYFYRLYEVF